MSTNLATAGAVDDPRLSMGEGHVPVPAEIRRKLHDPNVTLEEYFHYAAIQRDQERQGLDPAQRAVIENGGQPGYIGHASDADKSSTEKVADEKTVVGASPTTIEHGSIVSAQEWENASRAVRNASWGSIVYLITTDILGPSNAPWAIAQFGYVGGVLTYTCMGIMAFYAGWQIWRMFLRLDSDKYPMRTFGDMGFRIYGTATRHGMNILQSLQLLFNVGVIIIVNGIGFSQVVKFKLCFSICVFIWPLMGFALGQIRTLAKFGRLASLAIWMNLLVILMTMGVAYHSLPNYTAFPAGNTGPIIHTIWVPPGSNFNSQLNGAMQIVYAYGGAMLYCEFMSEMRRPLDFIKAQFVAEMFIYLCYLIFGLVVYSRQGQYTDNPANQGLSPYAWQTVTNILSLLSGLIAGVLYGNIGIKVIYQNVGQDLFGAPELSTKRGKLIWVALVPIYWSVAFLIASAVPAFTAISSMVSAVCIMQFTYTFPAILYLGMQVQADAMHPDEVFDPATGTVNRIDSWKNLSRWKRGLTRHWYFKLFNLLFFLASLATACLGMYAAGDSIKEVFDEGVVTSFGCKSPVDNS